MEMVVAELQHRLGNGDQSSDTNPSPCPFLGLEQTSKDVLPSKFIGSSDQITHAVKGLADL